MAIPRDMNEVRVWALLAVDRADEDCPRSLDDDVLECLRALLIPVAVVTDIANGISCSLCRAVIARGPRERLGVLARLRLKPLEVVDLALDAVERDNRLTALG